MQRVFIRWAGAALVTLAFSLSSARAADMWRRHVIHEGERVNAVVAADYTGDGRVDVISNSGGKTRLFVAPDWREVVIDETTVIDKVNPTLVPRSSGRQRKAAS